MDKIISKIAALGIPGLFLMVAIGASGYTGAAAITTALAALGPGGMIGGLFTLGAIGIVSEGITEFGLDAVFTAVVKELYNRGETKESIISKINKYPVSRGLKRKLKESLDNITID